MVEGEGIHSIRSKYFVSQFGFVIRPFVTFTPPWQLPFSHRKKYSTLKSSIRLKSKQVLGLYLPCNSWTCWRAKDLIGRYL